jgi:hypothetical protein
MTLQYEATTVRADSVDELATETAAFLNELDRDPRDWRVAPFVDKFAAGEGVYCALITAEIPLP